MQAALILFGKFQMKTRDRIDSEDDIGYDLAVAGNRNKQPLLFNFPKSRRIRKLKKRKLVGTKRTLCLKHEVSLQEERVQLQLGRCH